MLNDTHIQEHPWRLSGDGPEPSRRGRWAAAQGQIDSYGYLQGAVNSLCCFLFFSAVNQGRSKSGLSFDV